MGFLCFLVFFYFSNLIRFIIQEWGTQKFNQHSSSLSDYLGGIKFWFNYCSCLFQFIYSSLLVEFLSSPFLNYEFCHEKNKKTQKITKKIWKKAQKNSKPPLPGCKSWGQKSEHCPFGVYSQLVILISLYRITIHRSIE